MEILKDQKSPLEMQGLGGPFQIITADPPWDYSEKTFLNTGSMHNGVQETSHVTNHYKTMTFQELLNLAPSVKAVTDPEQCLLFMWATGPQLHQAVALGKAWGFEYKTVAFVWHKKSKGKYDKMLFPLMDHAENHPLPTTKKGKELKGLVHEALGSVGKEQCNPGYYTMSSTEPVLVFKKGRIPKPRGLRNVRQFFEDPRGEHSQKPTYVAEQIDLMFPEQKKLELFARERFRDWAAWGNEL